VGAADDVLEGVELAGFGIADGVDGAVRAFADALDEVIAEE
jgi:hypothetical protein